MLRLPVKRRALFETGKIVYLLVGEIRLNPDVPRRRAESEQSAKPIFVIKDVRLFLNTVARGVAMMQRAGPEAEYSPEKAFC